MNNSISTASASTSASTSASCVIDYRGNVLLHNTHLQGLANRFRKREMTIALFMGYHSRLGEKCTFNRYISKDLMKWFCTHYLQSKNIKDVVFVQKTISDIYRGRSGDMHLIYAFNSKRSRETPNVDAYSKLYLQTPMIRHGFIKPIDPR